MYPCPLCGHERCDHTPDERARGLVDAGGNRILPNLPLQYRHVELALKPLDRAADAPAGEPQIYEISFSSETPVQRWWGREILSHKKGDYDLRYIAKDGALLVDHRGDVVGVIVKSWISDKRGLAQIKFSRSARGKEVEQDVVDGIRARTSVGYWITDAELVKRGDTSYDDEWLCSWMATEVSLVGIPADLSVGVGRSAETGETLAVRIRGGVPAEEERTMEKCKVCQLTSCNHTAEERAGTSQPAETRNAGNGSQAPAAVEAARAQAAQGGGTTTIEVGPNTRDIAEIARLCERHGMSEKIAEFVERKLTVGDVRGLILEAKTTRPSTQPGSERVVDLSDKDAKRYSYRQLILEMAEGKGPQGIHREASDEIKRRLPEGYKSRGGVFVPTRLRSETQEEMDRRETRAAMSGIASGTGPELVGVERGEFIELLRNRAVVAQMGATIISDLAGNYEVVRQSAGSAATWVGEAPASGVGDTNPQFQVIGAVPKTLMSNTPYTRQLLVQTSGQVEQKVVNDLAKAHALAFDRSAIHGKGTNYEPEGIYNAPSIQVKAMGGQPDYPALVNMTALAADKNALLGNLGWITHPLMAGLLKTKLQAAAVPGWCWEGSILDGLVAGFKASSTAQMSKVMTGSADTGGAEIGMIFGNWADLDFLSWAAMELLVDLFSQKKSGIIEVTAFQMVDILVEHPESFVKATGATL